MAQAPDFKSETHHLTDGHERWERVWLRTINQQPKSYHVISMIGPKKFGFSQDASIPALRWAGCAKTRAGAARLVEDFVSENTENVTEEENAKLDAINRRRVAKGKPPLKRKEVPRQADADMMCVPGNTWILWPPRVPGDFVSITDRDMIYQYATRYINEIQSEGDRIEKRIRKDRKEEQRRRREERERRHANEDEDPEEDLEEKEEQPDDEPEAAAAAEGEEKKGEPEPEPEEEEEEEVEHDPHSEVSAADDAELKRNYRKMEKKFVEPAESSVMSESKFPYALITIAYPFSRYRPSVERQFLFRIDGAYMNEAEDIRAHLHEKVYESLFSVCLAQQMHWHPLPISVSTVKDRVLSDCKVLESTDRVMKYSRQVRNEAENET